MTFNNNNNNSGRDRYDNNDKETASDSDNSDSTDNDDNDDDDDETTNVSIMLSVFEKACDTLTVSCSSKSRLVLPSWFSGFTVFGAGSPG